jgi:3-hydroxybutyryl-CoA dehydratase
MTDVKGSGLWFEEFTEGLSIETRGRTITEADVVNFAGVSGDFNPMHTDAEFARTTQFGARVAHGALVFSIATGLAYQLGFLEGTIIAFTSFEMKLRAPVYIGDTIKMLATVSKRRAMPAAGGGFVTLDIKILNQKGETVQKGELVLLIKSSAAAVGASSSAEDSLTQPA